MVHPLAREAQASACGLSVAFVPTLSKDAPPERLSSGILHKPSNAKLEDVAGKNQSGGKADRKAEQRPSGRPEADARDGYEHTHHCSSGWDPRILVIGQYSARNLL